MNREKFLIGMYLGAIVIANLVVAKWGLETVADLGGAIGKIQVVFFTSLILIGLDLTSRDFLHEMWKEDLWENMMKLIVGGSLLSLVVNLFLKIIGWDGAPWDIVKAIALASTCAFFCAGVADTYIYQLLGDKERILRINGSNVVSGFVDSLVFPTLAWGVFLPMFLGIGMDIGSAVNWNITAQMTAAKIIGGFIWAFGIVKLAEMLEIEEKPSE